MVRLIVDDIHPLEPQQLAARPVEHLRIGLGGADRLRVVALQIAARHLRHRQRFSVLEAVIVGDDDVGAPDLGQHFRRDDFTRVVVIARLAGLKDAQPVLDGDARRDDQKTTAEVLALLARGVDRLPGDEHRHDRRLAAARRHLHRQPEQRRVGFFVVLRDLIEQAPCRRPARRDLGQPDHRFDRLDLAEEGTGPGPLLLRSPPVFQQPLGRRGNAPVGRVGNRTPRIHVAADLVDLRVLGIGLEIE